MISKNKKAALISTLALVALSLPMGAMAANKLIVKDAAGSTDMMSVTDSGWIGIGAGAAPSPRGPIHIQTSGTTILSGAISNMFTATGSNPFYYVSPSISFYRNNDSASSNGLLPRADDSVGAINFGTMIGTSAQAKAIIYGMAETPWTATDTPSYFSFLTNPGGVNPATGTSNANRKVMTIASTGTVTVNGGVRLYPYVGTNNNASIIPVKPGCTDATHKGTMWFTKNDGATDTLEICAEKAGTFAWRTLTF